MWCCDGSNQHLRHRKNSGLAGIVISSRAFAQPAHLCVRVTALACLHELLVVPTHPNERLCTCRVQAVRLQEVWPRICPQWHAVMLDAPLHQRASQMLFKFPAGIQRILTHPMHMSFIASKYGTCSVHPQVYFPYYA